MNSNYRESAFPFNLLSDVISSEFAADTESHPEDLVPTLLYILSDMKNPMIAKAMTLRYNNRMTLTEIGSILFMTAEGTRKLCIRGIEMLQETDTAAMIKLGLKEYYRQKYLTLAKAAPINVISPPLEPIGIDTSVADTIEVLNLSTRSVNCLHRAGINYVHQIKDAGIDDLLAIRNMGVLSASEVIRKVHDYYVADRVETA